MGIETIIGILIIVPVFYFIGRWLNKSEREGAKINNEKPLEPSKDSVKSWVIGIGIFVIIGVVFFILFWLNSWDRLSPEEQAQIEARKEFYMRDIKHCRSVLSAETINLNNVEFQRCNKVLQDFEDNAPTDSGRQSGPYEY